MTLERTIAAENYLEAGKILYEAAPSKPDWAAAVLERCIRATGLDHVVLREVLDASSLHAKFTNIRKLTRELESAEKLSRQQDVLRCMCYVAENVAKVRANAIEGDDFDEDSGHWLFKNVIDVLAKLGSIDATSEALAILQTAKMPGTD
jgi:hypothetical protein